MSSSPVAKSWPMDDRGQRNLAMKTERLLSSGMLLAKPAVPVKSLFIYMLVKSGRKDFFFINMNGLYPL